MEQTLELKKHENSFYIGESRDNYIALITFKYLSDNLIDVNHTYVNNNLRGQGIALLLMNRVVEFARENNLKMKASCSYAARVLQGSSKLEDVRG